MDTAAKENSIDVALGARRERSNKLSAAQGARPASSRTALGAKHVNTGSQISTGSPKRKRASGDSRRHSDGSTAKRLRLFPAPLEPVNAALDDGELTDEDSDQQQATRQTSTPRSFPRNTHRSASKLKSLYPRIAPADVPYLDIDLPSARPLSPIPDDGEDLLEGFDFSRPPRFGPHRYIPDFLAEVERNMKLNLDDFPDLDLDEDTSVSTMGPRTPPSVDRRSEI